MGGLRADLARKLPGYAGDFRDGMHPKVLASVLFLYFACLANAIAFGALTGKLTDNQVGIVEMLIVTAAGGVFYALFAGQPLTLLGGTGPVVIFTGLLYSVCNSFNLPFLSVYAWVGLWSALLLTILAMTDASAVMKHFTRFTDEIFAALISVIFILEALKSIMGDYADDNLTKAFLSTILALGTFMLAFRFKQATRWRYATRTLREFLSDFGPALAIVAMTVFASVFPQVPLERPVVPSELVTTSGRPWLVPLNTLPLGVIAACFGAALLVTILLFLDQNITTRIVNSRDNRLRKGGGYHLDLLIVAAVVGVGSLFGLPWIVAATVHSVNHLKSLADVEVQRGTTPAREVIVTVRENRVSGLGIHLLLGLSLFMLAWIQKIPMPVLFGLFLFMGFSSLGGNGFCERAMLWVTDPRLYPDNHYTRNIPSSTLHAFTLIQLVCFGILWALKSSPLGLLFPLMLVALVPIRIFVSRFFSKEDFDLLVAEDPEEALEMR